MPGFPPCPPRRARNLEYTCKLIGFRLYTVLEAAVPQLATARELRAPVTRLLLAAVADSTLWFREDGILSPDDYAGLLARLLIAGAKAAVATRMG